VSAPRWLVLSGHDREGRGVLEAKAVAGGLSRRHDCAAFTLLAEPELELLLDADAGLVIIGRMFERAGFARVAALDASVARAIVAMPGERLGTGYWGEYLAVAAGDRDDATFVRDPSGAIAAYWTRSGGVWLASADARLLASLMPAKPDVDFAAVAWRLARRGHHAAHTALAGVTELLPGHMVTFGDRVVCEPYWRPWDHVAAEAVAPAALRGIVDRTIDALARDYRRILVTVSGGLDSSIVAASLVAQRHEVALVTMATADPRGDERSHVDILARSLGLGFSTEPYDLDDIDPGIATSAHQPWPSARTFAQGYDRRRQSHAVEVGADAIFSGDGGDNVFGLTMSASPVVDRLLAEGPRAALRTAVDIAELTACSVPTVLGTAFARLWRGGGAAPGTDMHFLSILAGQLAASVEDHPWMAAVRGVSPGKAAHIATLIRAQRYLHGYAPGPARAVLPLVAQPIVEACLAIPSWLWCAGGENRAVVRAAYASLLPQALLRRRAKGGPDSFCVEIVERHRSAIREMLLDGLLSRAGLLDRDAIDRSLASGEAERRDVHRILALVDTEAWVRSWS
jgi:asparagine synthase (glutamine-hydrolysing)